MVKSFLTLSTLTLYTDDRQTAQTVSIPRPFPPPPTRAFACVQPPTVIDLAGGRGLTRLLCAQTIVNVALLLQAAVL